MSRRPPTGEDHEHKITIPARSYEDYDDSLQAAADDYAAAHGLEGWDFDPKWEDDQRDTIVLTVPDEK